MIPYTETCVISTKSSAFPGKAPHLWWFPEFALFGTSHFAQYCSFHFGESAYFVFIALENYDFPGTKCIISLCLPNFNHYFLIPLHYLGYLLHFLDIRWRDLWRFFWNTTWTTVLNPAGIPFLPQPPAKLPWYICSKRESFMPVLTTTPPGKALPPTC